ncbi:MAG: SH3 domain-containing protein [Betaproteobacteria bacterium]|jgi:SH3-like domain-containing protein|nr:MAG: SH3 domain-containing protein [Betaproteobacteria bacterium]
MCRRLVYSLILAVGVMFFCAVAQAIEFKSVADEIAILYDGPSKQSGKRLILTRGYPVEVIIISGNWVRVRDEIGTFAWIEVERLGEQRTVMIVKAVVGARASPGGSAPVVFRAEQGVVLDFLEVSGGWAKVRHRSGVAGFIRLRDLWGV